MARRRASSRRMKKERKKLLKQTIVFGTIAIAIILIFVFFVLPGFIRVVNSVLDTNPFEPQDTIPPQAPVISTPVEATTSANLTITGYGEAGSELTLLFNGQEETTTTIADDGQFELELTLEQGENIFEAFAEDQAGNQSAKSRSYIVAYDVTDPFIELEQPSDGEEIIGRENENFQVIGTTEAKAQMYINGRSVFTDSQGDFSHTLRLEEGENTINLRAVDQAGNTTEEEITVQFRF